MKRITYFSRSFVVIATALTSGCASYYSHFASFESRNSAGESRQFVVSWASAEYPEWSPFDNEATPITLETQCSKRKLVFQDNTHGSDCGASGIAVCGNPGEDIDERGLMLKSADYSCASITDAKGAKRIVDLQREIHLSISCLPDKPVVKTKDETINRDYLKNSVVPYRIMTKKVERHSLADKVPVISNKICDEGK